jgi:uncharacterized protein (DUF2249 family)
MSNEITLDIRTISPMHRHPLIHYLCRNHSEARSGEFLI